MFHFSVRDLLFVTCIAALVVGWSLDHRWQDDAEAKRKVAEEIATLATTKLADVQSELNLYKYGAIPPVGPAAPADVTQDLLFFDPVAEL